MESPKCKDFFMPEERVGKNCNGTEKPPLCPYKLKAVRDLALKYYPVDVAGDPAMEEKAWKQCTINDCN